jgi:hypothetical protein
MKTVIMTATSHAGMNKTVFPFSSNTCKKLTLLMLLRIFLMLAGIVTARVASSYAFYTLEFMKAIVLP